MNNNLWDHDDSEPLGDIDELLYGQSFNVINEDGEKQRILLVNVGTIGHCDYTRGESVITTILKTANIGPTMSIDTRKILVICAGMGLTPSITGAFKEYIENDTALTLSALDRRYSAIHIKPEKLNNRQSWQSMNRGEFSKKQRRNK